MDKPLHLARICLDLRAFRRWAGERQLLHRGVYDEGVALHHFFRESFDADLTPFRMLVPPGAAIGNVYVYCQLGERALRESVRSISTPETFHVIRRIESKVMPMDWRSGQRLGFDVRIWPVRRRHDGEGRSGKIIERDALHFLPEPEREPLHVEADDSTILARREAAYTAWLAERFEANQGAKIDPDNARLAKFQLVRIGSRNSPAAKTWWPDAVVHGILEITHSDLFNRLLAHGIGRRKAYGYGMLLLRPPSRTVHR